MTLHRLALLLCIGSLIGETCSSRPSTTVSRNRRASTSNITPGDRDLCPETDANKPANRIDTTERVAALRALMADPSRTGGERLDAYIINYGDEHLGSITDYDRRLQYISGFSGSSGYAAVTATKQALWTDGRYFLQVDQQMDCNWIMMKMSTEGYPTLIEWLVKEVGNGTVGANSRLLSISQWTSYASQLTMKEVPTDLIDQIWTQGRPARLNNHLDIHNLTFTGRTWKNKIDEVRTKMQEKQADALIVTGLDETAWLFNLRGNDRLTSPLFDSYAIITLSTIRFYIRNVTKLLTPEIAAHLGTSERGACPVPAGQCVEMHEYSTIMDDIKQVSEQQDVNKLWLSPNSNYAVSSAAGQKGDVSSTPIALMKSVKNDVEKKNYRKCQVRDSAAVVEFVAFLEQEIAQNKHWTEVSAAEKLTEVRSTYDYNWGISFETISSVGPNAAVIHYRPDNNTDRVISTREVYLLDSGGQYQDGTTDVTRTFHFGTPSDEEKEAYTRVLIGQIELATTVWPAGLKGNEIDARTRAPLWERGWDYKHGTGHGIGYFLQVHEGPARIGISYRAASWQPLYAGMFFSDEPGFYQDGKYGIRLETIVEIVTADTQENAGKYLAFNPVTLVPYEPKFILYDMLNEKQRKWLNAYNKRCLEETGEYLKERGKMQAYDWIKARTSYIPDVPTWSGDTNSVSRTMLSLSTLILSLLAVKLSSFQS